jgi:hypothetical protein
MKQNIRTVTLHKGFVPLFFVVSFFATTMVTRIGPLHRIRTTTATVTPPLNVPPDSSFRGLQVSVEIGSLLSLLGASSTGLDLGSDVLKVFEMPQLLPFAGFSLTQHGVKVLQQRVQVRWQRTETGAHVQQILSRLTRGELLRQQLTLPVGFLPELFQFGFQRGICEIGWHRLIRLLLMISVGGLVIDTISNGVTVRRRHHGNGKKASAKGSCSQRGDRRVNVLFGLL